MSQTKSQGVAARIRALEAKNQGEATLTLEVSGIEVTYPKMINHGQWQKAQRLAKADFAKAQTLLAITTCSFDGEKITADDFNRLPMKDSLAITGALFGGEDETEAEGKDEAASAA